MFSQVLIKPIQAGEKLFHIIAPLLENLDEYEKLGLEIIKDAQLMKQKFQEAQEAKAKEDAEKPAEFPVEAPKVEELPQAE